MPFQSQDSDIIIQPGRVVLFEMAHSAYGYPLQDRTGNKE